MLVSHSQSVSSSTSLHAQRLPVPGMLGSFRPGLTVVEDGDTFLHRSAGNTEEISAVGLGESTVAIGVVCRDPEPRSIELKGDLNLRPHGPEPGGQVWQYCDVGDGS
jgi:hypothetical protein